MYAHIAFDAGWISWNTSAINAEFLATKALDEDAARHHQELAAQLLDRVFKSRPGTGSTTENANEQQRVAAALRALVPWLNRTYLDDPAKFDFAIHCAIAHHRLPDGERLARETRIAGIVDGLLADAPAWSANCGPGWAPHKTLGILLPDVFLDSHLRSMAGRLVMATCAIAVSAQKLNPMSSLLKVLPMPGPQGRPAETRFFNIVANLYLTRAPAERPALIGLVGKLKEQKLFDWTIRANDLLRDAQAANVDRVIQDDCLVTILRETWALKDEQVRQQVVRFQLDQLVDMQKARTQQVVQLTIDAVLAGVPLGDAYTAQVKAALAAEQQTTDGVQRTADAAHLQVRQAAPGVPEHAPTAPADADPVHAWSVERLAAWIEGPVTRQPIDRQRIVARERLLVHEREQRRVPADANVPEPELAPEDINLAVDDALRSTAAFFRDDLTEMLALAKQLGVGPAPIKQGMQQRELMAKLASPGAAVDDEQTRTLLVAAESAMALLRSNIQRSQTSLRQRMNFTQALNAALQEETLAQGKREGGVIACPMPLSSWQWVFDTFHACWLYQKRRLSVNKVQVPLRSDQALALYVTGNSLSGYAFDITVHLWQRRPGATSLPSVDTDGGLRMNTDDWFDTYTPCAVLHVPLGK